jgi:uncharacterized protein with ParB-like and HNH nuclease domain
MDWIQGRINMGEKNIEIRSIKSLLDQKEKFNIPRYQRGYRWEKNQIIELLDDIYDYGLKAYKSNTSGETVGDFYCLQPVVVKQNKQKEPGETWWDIIDGQQRLTTIYIIIKYLQSFYPMAQIPLFIIDYERDEGQGCDFLNNITFVKSNDNSISPKNINTDNVDIYHMDKCSIYIKDWFTDHHGAEDYIKMILTSMDENNVSVIWYEINTNTDNENSVNPIEVFRRLNIGKIPLTDSELIKAFLLQGDRYQRNEDKYIHQRLSEIAKEWDNIEYHLQNDEMWAFLNNNNYKPEARIDYLFKLLSENWNLTLNEKQRIAVSDKQFEYRVFEKYISNKRREKGNNIKTVADIFDEINLLFSVLFEWYNDRRMYHYIGFLVYHNEKESEKFIKLLFRYFQGDGPSDGNHCQNGHKKEECLDYVKTEIKKIISLEQNQKLETLNYYKHHTKILQILLFLNIESTVRLEKEDTYFPFHLYKREEQSIEHIYPRTPEEMDYDQAKLWLKSNALTVSSIINNTNRPEYEKNGCENINERINDLVKHPNDEHFKNEFEILSHDIEKLYEEMQNTSADETETLSNYALVGKAVNSKLSNSSFVDKREIIIKIIDGKETDSNGDKFDKYIPVCTRNVFQKYYTLQPDNIILWDKKDRTAYFNAMKNIYDNFINTTNTEVDN